MKISSESGISMPLRNLLSILGATAIGVYAYFGIIERLNNIETRATLFEADLLKAADQKPIDNEQYMLLEFLSGQFETIEEEIQFIESNNINIEFLQKQVSKLQTDVEELKDKVRNNGSHRNSFCTLYVCQRIVRRTHDDRRFIWLSKSKKRS